MAESSQVKSIVATLVVLIGVGIVLFFFFQPWIEVKLLVKSLKYSGMGLADKSSAILLVPLLAVTTGIAIVMFLVRKRAKFRILAMLVSLLGILFVILIFVQINGEISNWVAKITRFQYRFGIMAVLIGFLIQLIGTMIGNFKTTKAISLPQTDK